MSNLVLISGMILVSKWNNWKSLEIAETIYTPLFQTLHFWPVQIMSATFGKKHSEENSRKHPVIQSIYSVCFNIHDIYSIVCVQQLHVIYSFYLFVCMVYFMCHCYLFLIISVSLRPLQSSCLPVYLYICLPTLNKDYLLTYLLINTTYTQYNNNNIFITKLMGP